MEEPMTRKLYALRSEPEDGTRCLNLWYYYTAPSGQLIRCKGRGMKIDYADMPRAISLLQREFQGMSFIQADQEKRDEQEQRDNENQDSVTR